MLKLVEAFRNMCIKVQHIIYKYREAWAYSRGGGQLIMMGNCPPLRILKEGKEKGLKDERKKEKRGKDKQNLYLFL